MLIANFVGILLYFYLIWKRLKEDYLPEKIFNLALFSLAGALLGKGISNFFLENYDFWLPLIFAFAFFAMGAFRLKINFYESLDALIISYLPWISFLFLAAAVKEKSLFDFLSFWVCLMLIFIYFFLSANYKKFTWYKSGRVGFSGLVTSFLAFLINSFFAKGMELYFSLALVFLSLVLLFILIYAKN